MNQVSSAGIIRVRTPSAVALIHITFATLPTRASRLWDALFHMFPARAKTVIPIMRIDQIKSSLVSRAKSSRNSLGSMRRKRADAPKTMEPACRVLRSAGYFMVKDYNDYSRYWVVFRVYGISIRKN